MKTLVLKFGGTSMQTVGIIKHVAEIIKTKKEQFNNIIVVVSAMAQQTNKLVQLVEECQPKGENKHWNIDSVISTGEQITAGLLALCLQNIGIEAIGLSSWQIPIKTNNKWSNADITEINTNKLEALCAKNIVPIITGFQGIAEITDIISETITIPTTLGRGGSDTSAVALACALKADKCEIFTDVPGVFTADPNKIPQAKLIEKIDYHFLEKLTNAGAKVVHPEAAKLASEHKINLSILSTFSPEGTRTQVVNEAPKPSCLVQKEVIGIEGKLDHIPENAMYYTYDPKTKHFLGFFEEMPYINDIITNLHYFKPYKITILNPEEKLMNLDIKSLLLKAEIECFYVAKKEDITIIIDHKTLQKALNLLYLIIQEK